MKSTKMLNESNVRTILKWINLSASIDKSINDLVIASDMVWSSKKISDQAIELKHSLEQYIQSSINGLTHLKKEIVDVLPSDEDAKENILYLVKDTSVVDDDVYNQYLSIDGKLELLGSTAMTLENIYLKSEVDSKFALISNLQTLIDMVGNASDLETTLKDTLVNAINSLKEELDEKEVVKEITWAEYQALSEEEKKNGTRYDIPDMPTNLETGGLVHIANYTDDDVPNLDFNNFLDEGIYTFGVNAIIPNSPLDVITTYGSLKVIKYKNKGYTFIEQIYDYLPSGFLYVYGRRYIVEYDEWSDWHKISGTPVPDVAKTSITSFSTSSISGKLTYKVVNGICYVTICPMANSSVATDIEVYQLPKPDMEINKALVSNNDKENIGIVWMNENKPNLMGRFFTANKNGYNTFSYPVADDWRP